ncbi:hypothetical protein NTE_03385 [Candidatus Nitrososphaera evergladensis SR1]|uniref:Uncharacterized protein n=1 Tax=Candidatus Nitrososphaera evergladensis SR1 TaxID=1459636 RepID=A0A075MWA0_9ARCH|nr:hypothetical protein [Candidatus Nitrososphaera evergladensis]AIF85413.1 hypothetical protein NTE_03385 [Candidatus Nitrososphaera evergladensis SR1]
MPPKNPKNAQGVVNVEFYKSVYEIAQKAAEAKGKSLKDFVNDIVLMSVEKDEFLKRYAPSLSFAGRTETSLFVKDDMKDRTAEIVIKDSQLICYLDESNDCEHVHFALALPELGTLNIKQKSVLPMTFTDSAGKTHLIDFRQGRPYCFKCKSYGCDYADIAETEHAIATNRPNKKANRGGESRVKDDS